MAETELAVNRLQLQYVFLDRDGVVNRKPPEDEFIRDWQSFELLPAVPESIARLNNAGVKVIVVTNQRGIALGHLSEDDLHVLHRELQRFLSDWGAHIDAIFYCPHDRNACNCRKPKPGLFVKAFREFPQAGPNNSVVIGDSISDIEAGRNLGMPTIFVRGNPQTQKSGALEAESLADATVHSLQEAVSLLLSP